MKPQARQLLLLNTLDLVVVAVQGVTPLDAAEGSPRHVIVMLGGKNDAYVETQRITEIVATARNAVRLVASWLLRRPW